MTDILLNDLGWHEHGKEWPLATDMAAVMMGHVEFAVLNHPVSHGSTIWTDSSKGWDIAQDLGDSVQQHTLNY